MNTNRMKVKIFEHCEDGGTVKPTGGAAVIEAEFFQWSKDHPDITVKSVTSAMAVDSGGTEYFGAVTQTLTVLFEEPAPDIRDHLDMLHSLDRFMMMFQDCQSKMKDGRGASQNFTVELADLFSHWKKHRSLA